MDARTPFTPQVVLLVGAHTDDIDCHAAGSVAKWVRGGAVVHYLLVTDGSKGAHDPNITSEQLVTRREQEQRAAATSLGVREVHFLRYEDSALAATMPLKKDIVRVIRSLRPDTVVVMDPTTVYADEVGLLNHPDHRAAGQATLDAVYPLAGDRLSFPELLEQEQLAPHSVLHLLLITRHGDHNYSVDVTDVFEAKVAAALMHKSQIAEPVAARTALENRAAVVGAKMGCKYAEGFLRIDVRGELD